MVKGLSLFQRHFSEYNDQYVLIGGAACDLAMHEAGLDFRATKDLDIVLCIESLSGLFVKAFWEFIRNGNYQNRQKSSGRRMLYRFNQPASDGYPYMLELFSRKPDALSPVEGSHLTPIPAGSEVSSLSAILIDNDYYELIHGGKRIVEGVPIVRPEHIIPLKAKAWLELKSRRDQGEQVDMKSISKHKNDIFRLYRIIDPEYSFGMPGRLRDDMKIFLQDIRREQIDLPALGLKNRTVEVILDDFRKIYKIG